MTRYILSILTAITLSCPLFAASLTIESVEPTVLFNKEKPEEQITWVTVKNDASETITAIAVVTVDNKESPRRRVLKVEPGITNQIVFIPYMTEKSNVKISFLVNGKEAASHAQEWKPQRKWKIFLVKGSHEDIGYENFLWMKQKEIADFMDIGAHFSTRKSGPQNTVEGTTAIGGFSFFLESMLFTRYYLDERGPIKLRKFIDTNIRSNWTPLAGAPNGGIHFHWMDSEEAVRAMYPARRHFRDRYDVDINTYLSIDNPSISWAAAQIIADSGFKYAVRFGQPFRTGNKNSYATTGLPAVFWWKTPDAKTRILYSWRHHYGINFWFGQTTGGYSDMSDLGARNVQKELLKIEDGELGPYPYDALMIPSYQDHENPVWDNRALRRWQARFSYPEIIITGPNDFMEHIEKNYADVIPELSGDLNNNSADYASIDPTSNQWKRSASRILPMAEGLSSVLATHKVSERPLPNEINAAYTHMFDFDEHSWPTSPPAGEFHQFNAQWGKHLEGRRALVATKQLLDTTLTQLSSLVSTDKERLLVFNPLAHPRNDVLVLDEAIKGTLIDPASGQALPSQIDKDGKQHILVKDIPAFGYKTYLIKTGDAQIAQAPKKSSDLKLENEYYSITLNKTTGSIAEIQDKQLKKQLIDKSAEYKFNQPILVSKKTRTGLQGSNYASNASASFTRVDGPIFSEITAISKDAKLGDAILNHTVRLYHHDKRIDIINDLSHVAALHSDKHGDRYKENLFYAFPFDVKNFTHRVDMPVGTVRPYADQLRFGTHDYLVANRWIAVASKDYTIAVAPWNAPVFHLGEIRYNQFSIDYKPKSSHLFSYAWSNRMAGLIAINANDLNASIRYTIASYPGDWNEGNTTNFAASIASPLKAQILKPGTKGPLSSEDRSFVSIDAPNVQMTVLKESEQPGRGWIVRLLETQGKSTTVNIRIPALPVTQATLTNLAEDDTETAYSIKNGVLSLKVEPNTLTTLRLHNGKPTFPAPKSLKSDAVTDSTVTLKWDAVKGAASYNIYRSIDPQDPAMTETFVGRSNSAEFTDRGLDIGATYYYQVVPVNAANTQGSDFAKLIVTTATKNTTPPSSITIADGVRFKPDTVLLVWNIVRESDVARYYVTRSTPEDPTEKQIAVVHPSGYYVEHYKDTGLKPGQTYYYHIYPEDWADNRQPVSRTISVTTPTE